MSALVNVRGKLRRLQRSRSRMSCNALDLSRELSDRIRSFFRTVDLAGVLDRLKDFARNKRAMNDFVCLRTVVLDNPHAIATRENIEENVVRASCRDFNLVASFVVVFPWLQSTKYQST